MSVSAPNRYPNLQGMMDLFRSLVNDDGSGTDGPQGGIIATNAAPFTLPFLNSGIRDLFSDLRNIGDPALILDNYLLTGLPALAGPNPAVQVSLGFLGYFDGFENHSRWTLPAGAMGVDRVWERVTGSNLDFRPLSARADGLTPMQQVSRNGVYEWRGNALWMPGSLESMDLRLRCKITLPDILGTNLDFTTTYVPILNCTNAIVDKMLVSYARRFAPEQLSAAQQAGMSSLFRLQREIVRLAQRADVARADFGGEAVAGFGWASDL